jgi:hypothetical protein
VFNASQLPSDSPVLIGRVEKHLCVRTGAWTFWLPIETEARFPRVDDIIPRTAMMPNLVEVHPADAQFLTENLPRLPQQETDSGIVTLDLNGSVLVRSRSSGDSPSTELRLSNSLKTGDDLRVVSDRRYLSRAMALGLTRWHLANADSPMLAQDERRSYVWALWDKGSAVKPSEDALVVESPVARAVRTAVSPAPLPAPAAPLPPTPTPPAPVLRSMTMPRQKPIPAMPEQTMDTMSIVEQQDTNTSAASPIEQAIRLRGVLRDALTATNDLIGSLKRQQKQQRAYKSAIASLRELQGVA